MGTPVRRLIDIDKVTARQFNRADRALRPARRLVTRNGVRFEVDLIIETLRDFEVSQVKRRRRIDNPNLITNNRRPKRDPTDPLHSHG